VDSAHVGTQDAIQGRAGNAGGDSDVGVRHASLEKGAQSLAHRADIEPARCLTWDRLRRRRNRRQHRQLAPATCGSIVAGADTDDERDHLYYLARRTPPAFHRPNTHVSPGLLHVLDHLTDSAAVVVSDLGETLVQNSVAIALNGDDSNREGLDRYAIWRLFTDPATERSFPRRTGRPTRARTSPISARPPPDATAIPTSSSWSSG
jgi:hypothetical protein